MTRELTFEFKDASQEAIVGKRISVFLLNTETKEYVAAGIQDEDGEAITTELTINTNENGVAVFELTPQNKILGVDTRYQVEFDNQVFHIIMPNRDADFRELINIGTPSFATPVNLYNQLIKADGIIGSSYVRIYTDTLDMNTPNNRVNIATRTGGHVVCISHINEQGVNQGDRLGKIPTSSTLSIIDQNTLKGSEYRIEENLGVVTHGDTAFQCFNVIETDNSEGNTFSEGDTCVINSNFVDLSEVPDPVVIGGAAVLDDGIPQRSKESEGVAGNSDKVSRSSHRHQTPVVEEVTSDPSSSDGQDDDVRINTVTNSWWKKKNGTWVKIWAIGSDGTGFDATNYFVHLGTDNIDDDTKSGVRSGGTSSWTLSTSNANEDVWLPIEFQNVAGENNVPSKATYDATTGSLVLPEGQWIVCASLKFKDRKIQNNERVLGDVGIDFDGDIRHAQSVYMTNRISGGGAIGTEEQLNNMQGLVSTAGVIVSDGSKAVKIVIKLLATENNEIIDLVGAHLHAVKAFVSDSSQGEQGASVWVQYSTDATTWLNSFESGRSIQYIRQAVAINRPADDSTDWTPAIRIRGTGGGDQEDFDPEFIQTQLDVLKNTTHDLHSPQPPPEWEDATADSQGGLATQSAAFGRISATEATYTLSISSGLGGNHIAVRIPEDKERGEYRIQIDSGDNTYYENLSHFGFLGTHNNFELYGLSTPLSSDVTSAKLQVSTGKSHIGTSTFEGNLNTDKTLEAAGLPEFDTTNRGQVVKRKSDGDGFEYDDEEAGVTLSDKDPEDVGTTASSGTDDEVSRSDHVHKGEEVPEQLFPYTFYRAFDKTTEANVRLQSGTTTASFTKRTTNVSAAVDVALEWTNTVSTETITNPSVKMFLDIPTVDADHDLYEIVVLLPGTTRDITTVNIESFGRVQHSKIPLSNDTPEDIGKVASPGDDNVASRDDHVHKLGDDVVTEDTIVDESVTEAKLSTAVQTKLNEAGTTSIADNSVTRAKLSASLRTAITNAEIVAEDVPTPASGDAGKFIKVNSSETAYELTDAPSGGGSASLSDATPHDVDEEMGSAGTGTRASREDHVHQVEGIPTALTQSLDGQNLVTELQLAGKTDLQHTLDLSSIAGGGGSGGGSGGMSSRTTGTHIATSSMTSPNRNFVLTLDGATERQLHLYERTNINNLGADQPADGRGYVYHNVQIALPTDLYFTVIGSRTTLRPSIIILDRPTNNVIITGLRVDGSNAATDSSDISGYTSLYSHWIATVDFTTLAGQTGKQTVSWTKIDKQLPVLVNENNADIGRGQFFIRDTFSSSVYATALEISDTDVRLLIIPSARINNTTISNISWEYTISTFNPTTSAIGDPAPYALSTGVRTGQRAAFAPPFSSSSGLRFLGFSSEPLNNFYTFFWYTFIDIRFSTDNYYLSVLDFNPADNTFRFTAGSSRAWWIDLGTGFSGMYIFRQRLSAITTIGLFSGRTTRFIAFNHTTGGFTRTTGWISELLVLPSNVMVDGVDTPINDSLFGRVEQSFPEQVITWALTQAAIDAGHYRVSGNSVEHDDVLPENTALFALETEDENGDVVHRAYFNVGHSYDEEIRFHDNTNNRLYDFEIIEDFPAISTGQVVSVADLNVPQGTVFKLYTLTLGVGGSGSGSGTGTDPTTRDQLQALDFTVDTFSTALSQLPVYNEGAWANADATAVAAGVAYGYWAQGETPSSYNGITWQDAPFTLPDGGNRLMAIRVPSGFPIKFARLTWRRGAQTVTLPPTLTTEWNKWNVTDNPDHYDVYHLATVGTTDFAAIATQTGDVLAVQIPALSYDSTMADNAARVPALDNQLGGISHTLDEAHRLLNSITSSTPPTSGWVSQTTGDQGTQVGYADIRSNGTQNPSVRARIDFDGTYLMGTIDAGSRIPVIWTPVGADPNRYRILHERGGSTHATYPGNGQYWRRYTPAGADDVIGSRHDAFFLAAEASDAPISVTVASGDLFQLQRGPANEEIDIPESALSTDVQAKLNGGGQGLMAYKPYPLTAGNTRVQADSAAIRVPITAIPETNPYASSISSSQFTLKAGLYDFFFGTTWYAASTGTAVQNANQRGDVVITAHGTEIEFWQNLPYVRPVSSSSGTFGDLGHIAVRVWVPQDTTVHFQMSIEAQSTQGFLGMDSIDFMCISGGAE